MVLEVELRQDALPGHPGASRLTANPLPSEGNGASGDDGTIDSWVQVRLGRAAESMGARLPPPFSTIRARLRSHRVGVRPSQLPKSQRRSKPQLPFRQRQRGSVIHHRQITPETGRQIVARTSVKFVRAVRSTLGGRRSPRLVRLTRPAPRPQAPARSRRCASRRLRHARAGSRRHPPQGEAPADRRASCG